MADAAAGDDDRAGLFGPGSALWEVHREAVVLLGGRRALLMQVAHPLVAAGVHDWSGVGTEPFRRLVRTLALSLRWVFGDRRAALAAVARVNETHARVHGTAPDGRPYDARDPELLLWVLATLIDTSFVVHEAFVGPLPEASRARYLAESRTIGALLGIPEELVPRTGPELAAYVRRMLDTEVRVSAQALALADAILYPPFPFVPRSILAFLNPFTIALLPEELRAQYGFGLYGGRRAASRALHAALRALVRAAPAPLRRLPHAWLAAWRSGATIARA